MSLSNSDEIDILNERCDNLQMMLTDLATRLGQHELAFEMTRFHNETVRKLKEARKS